MPRLACVLTALALLLPGCNGSDPGAQSQQYNINQDINASFGSNIPTSSNPGAPGFGSSSDDVYGYNQVWER